MVPHMGSWNIKITLGEYQVYLNKLWTLIYNNVSILVHYMWQTHHAMRCQKISKTGSKIDDNSVLTSQFFCKSKSILKFKKLF